MTDGELDLDLSEPSRTAGVARPAVEDAPAAPGARRRAWPWLALLWVAVTAYNLAKPFHIDDTAHLEIARWISAHPLHPMQGTLNWEGGDQPISATNQPHLYFYLLAGWASVFGYSEVALHAMQSIFALACIVLFHRQARYFCPSLALWLTALLVLGPAFVVEQNLMVDVPLLAMWLLFFDALLLQRDSRAQTRRYVVAGVACAAAILTKYSSLTLVPVLVVSLLLERRARQAWTVLIPVGALVAWSAFNYWDYGGIHVLTRESSDRSVLQPLRFAVAWVLVLGAVTPLGVLAAVQLRPWLRRHERRAYALVVAALVLLALVVAVGLVPDRLADLALAAAFAVDGALLLVGLLPFLLRALGAAWRDRSLVSRSPLVVTLLLWVAGGTAFYVLFAPFIAVRHVLLILPAVLLLVGMCLGDRLTRAAKGFALGITVLVSVGLCLGDWQFAAFYRTSAPEIARSLPPTGTVWTSGHWGWQWYAEQNGMREIDADALDLRPGDWVVVADDAEGVEVEPNLVLTRTVTQQDPLASLFCTARVARFYTSGLHGPWSLSRDCVGRISIYQVPR